MKKQKRVKILKEVKEAFASEAEDWCIGETFLEFNRRNHIKTEKYRTPPKVVSNWLGKPKITKIWGYNGLIPNKLFSGQSMLQWLSWVFSSMKDTRESEKDDRYQIQRGCKELKRMNEIFTSKRLKKLRDEVGVRIRVITENPDLRNLGEDNQKNKYLLMAYFAIKRFYSLSEEKIYKILAVMSILYRTSNVRCCKPNNQSRILYPGYGLSDRVVIKERKALESETKDFPDCENLMLSDERNPEDKTLICDSTFCIKEVAAIRKRIERLIRQHPKQCFSEYLEEKITSRHIRIEKVLA